MSENGIKTRKKIHVGIKELQPISPQLEIRGYSSHKKRKMELRHKKNKNTVNRKQKLPLKGQMQKRKRKKMK